MSESVKRPYTSTVRTERAAATHSSIRVAAATAFLEQGYVASTMRDIAARAGVGERTLYDAFPNKEALFLEVVGVAIGGDDRPLPVSGRPEFLAALDADDPAAVVETFAAYSADLLDRAGALIMVAVESAGADEAMRRFSELGAAETAANVATVVDHLVDVGAIGDRRQAVASMTALVSPHVHQIVRGVGGLSAEEYRTWLRAALSQILTRD